MRRAPGIGCYSPDFRIGIILYLASYKKEGFMEDKLVIGGHEFSSRFILGSGKYSLKLIEAAVRDAGAQIVTLAVRRANTKDHENILDYIL